MENNEGNQAPAYAVMPVIIEMASGNELTELVTPPFTESPQTPDLDGKQPADPEFDAYLAVVKLLIGGTIEGTAELIRRLERIEAELRANGFDPDKPGDIESAGDVARYMLVGMTLSVSDGVRRQVIKLAEASDVFWRLTGSAVDPIVENRFTGIFLRPFDRAFNRFVQRGQVRVNDWVELGRRNEPAARIQARQLTLEIIDDFISHLSENEELAQLVQEQSVGLATEAVDEFRTRTVSADAVAEDIVRRILRRPPRQMLPQPPEAVLEAAAYRKDLA
ncbi:MAG: hypothetical protein R6X18_02355 [Chloroflexota bacterium]|jgi:hypothetical protein